MDKKRFNSPLRYFGLPADAPKKQALMRYGEWIEIYPGEVFLAHISNRKYLESCGFVLSKGPTIYRSQKLAKKGRKDGVKAMITG